MANITYLLGAGASRNALPIVKEFQDSLSKILTDLNRLKTNTAFYSIGDNNQRCWNIAFDHLQQLLSGCENHASVDTYAKMLFLTKNKHKYQATKFTLTLFFELYQFFNKSFDKRYDAFFASVLNPEEPIFPKNINILSWNYDYEIEKAYLKYSGFTTLEDTYNHLSVIHKNHLNPKVSDNFKIIKINGTTGILIKQNGQYSITLGLGQYEKDYNDEISCLSSIFRNYCSCFDVRNRDKIQSAISFSWEKGIEHEKILIEAKKIMNNNSTNILVVIGYSFPYFNREFDKILLKDFMPNSSTKIYIQDFNADELVENVIGLNPNWHNKIIPIKNLDQFYIPYEF